MAWTTEQKAEYMRDWRTRNREQANEIQRRSWAKTSGTDIRKAARRRWHLKTKYGISLEEFQLKLDQQSGVCAVCRQPETAIRRGSTKSLDVDHNHTTGKVRGLLCSDCNIALGLLDESPKLIQALADYLTHWTSKA